MKKHLLIACGALLILGFAFKDIVVVSSHPCAQDINVYDACRDEGLSEKLCVIRSASQVDVAKSCLDQNNLKTSSVNTYSQLSSYFSESLVTTAPVYEDRVTVMLSPTKTERKTIIHDFNDSVSKEGYQAMLQIVSDLEGNETKLFGLVQSPSYEKEVAEYMIDAIDAYDVKAVDNWSSYFASIDPAVNPNIFDVVIKNANDLALFVAEMKAKDGVEIFPVYIPQLYAVPNDPQANVRYLQGGNGVNAYEARDQLSGTTLGSVQVGIVDDGFYVSHEDLSIASATPAGAGGGHGTHVAGLVGALTNNGKGVPSAARNIGNIQIRGYNYRFGQGDNDGSSNIMGLVQQAVQDGAKVINMSWGGGGYSAADQQIFTSAYNQGVVLIAAAGNDSASQPGYPARYAGVISVGATTSAGSLASFSNRSADILSPGSSIVSTCIGGGYCNHSGTSMASPLAASVAALLLSINPGLSPDQIQNILQSTTNAKGVINACNAVASLLQNGYKCTGSSSGTTNGGTSSGGGGTVNGVCADQPLGVEQQEDDFGPQRTTVGTMIQEGALLPSNEELSGLPQQNNEQGRTLINDSIAQPIQEGGPRPRFLTMSAREENKYGSVTYSLIAETPRDEVSKDLLLCNNNKKDGDETDIDCGGSCKKCLYSNECLLPTDCSTNYCVTYAGGIIGSGAGGGNNGGANGGNNGGANGGNNGGMSGSYETVRFEVTVSPNVLYPSQYANVVIKALNKMHQVNTQATNSYKVSLEGITSGTVALPSAGMFTLNDYGVKFYEPGFAASQRGAYTLIVEDTTNPAIRGSMPITVLGGSSGGGTTAGGTNGGGSSGGGTSGGGTSSGSSGGGSSGGGTQGCDSDADCRSDEYCRKSLLSTEEFIPQTEDEEIPLPEHEKITIGENEIYVKYKDNDTVFFTDFDGSTTSVQEYKTALQTTNLSTVQEVRSKAMTLATYREFAQIRAMSTLQVVFEDHEITKLERPLANYETFDRATNYYKITTTPQEVDEVIAKLAEDRSVEYVESGKKEFYPYADIQINDPEINTQWHIWGKNKNAGGINVVEARNIAQDAPRNGGAIYIVIGDTGIEGTHDDLKNQVIGNPRDSHYHGTHVAGLAAAQANNAIGVIGGAGNESNVKLVATSLCDIPGAARAMQGKKGVVNFSCGAGLSTTSLAQYEKDAADAIIAGGSVIVAAAGNGGHGDSNNGGHQNASQNPPCNYGPIVCIGATTVNNAKAGFSSFGSAVDLSAPGEGIHSTCVNNKYCKLSGTSMATPVAAGAVAFLMSLGATGPQAVQLLKETAVQITGNPSGMGVGRIDLCNATAKFLGKPACSNSFVPSPGGGETTAGSTSAGTTTTAGGTSAGGTSSGGGTGKGQCVPRNPGGGNNGGGNNGGGDNGGGSDGGGDDGGDYDQCADGIKNGSETDVDCGGSYCPKCEKGKMCGIGNDCLTNYCNTGNGSGGDSGTGTYECLELSGATLGSQNAPFSDGSNLESVFGTTNEYLLIDVSKTNCSACTSLGQAMNQDTALQKLLSPDSTCGFLSVVATSNLSARKSHIGGFVAAHSKGYGSPSGSIRPMLEEFGNKIGLNNPINATPRYVFMKRDGTFINQEISLSHTTIKNIVQQYCTMCPFKQNPPVGTGEVCGDTVDRNGDGFTGVFYAAMDYNNDKKLNSMDLVVHSKVELNLQSPLSGKIYDINNDMFINTGDRNLIQNHILGTQVDIEICNDGIDNDCDGKIDAADDKCIINNPPEGSALCQSLKIFDCDANGTFNSGDVEHLRKAILGIIPSVSLPVCDANGSSDHSTLDLVLMQRLLLGFPNADQSLILFDYDNNGLFNDADKTRLQTIILNNESCPSGKACDINRDNSLSSLDTILLTQLQNVTAIAEQCGSDMGTGSNSGSGENSGSGTTAPASVWCDSDKDSFFAQVSVPTNNTAGYPYATLQSNGLYEYCTTSICKINISCQALAGNDCDDEQSSIKNPGSVCETEQGTGTLTEQCVCFVSPGPPPTTPDPLPNIEICTDSLDNDGDGAISCADADCAVASSCQLTIQPNCAAVKVFDCNGNGTFTFDDIEALRKGILGITTAPTLPICDPNGSNSHSTLDLVHLQAIVNGNASVNSLTLFDYNSDGAVNSTDLMMLWPIFYGQTTCPSGKVCDLNNGGGTNIVDLNVLNRIINNSLTSCDVGCGNGTKEGTEGCDDGNLTNGDGCSNLCQFEQQQTPQEPEGPPTASFFQRMVVYVSSLFSTSSDTITKLYARLWFNNDVNNEGVFETASLKPSRMMCGNGICETEKNESPTSCVEDCGCGNGLINPRREQCDDGNRVAGDGCSETCTKELRGKMCAYFPGTEPPANLIGNDGTIVTPPVRPDPDNPDNGNNQCHKGLLYCLEGVCSNYKDIQAGCYKKCCESFAYCADAVKMCSYRGPGGGTGSNDAGGISSGGNSNTGGVIGDGGRGTGTGSNGSGTGGYIIGLPMGRY